MLIANLDTFKSYGVNTVSVFFMGSRYGDVKGYKPDAGLNPVYTSRMSRIIEAADARGMIVLVGTLYWGGSKAKEGLGWVPGTTAGQAMANQAITNTVQWLKDNNYRNVIVDSDNEGMSGFNVNQLSLAGHAVDSTIMIASNSSSQDAPDTNLSIHFGRKVPGKPYFESEYVPDAGNYWGSYSKQSNYYNYIRIGRYTEAMKNLVKTQTKDFIDYYNGLCFSSTWIQCAPSEGIGGPFMTPGGMSNIADVEVNITTLHPDAGIRWWLEYIKTTYGAWVPPALK